MTSVAMKARWKADDGRTWPYFGPSGPGRLGDMPEEIKSAIEDGAIVVDTVLNLQISHDGAEFIITEPVTQEEPTCASKRTNSENSKSLLAVK